MDDLGYEWYTGFRTPRAVGESIEETKEVSPKVAEQAEVENDDAPVACNARPKAPIEFTGIAVEISHCDQMDIISQVNSAIEKWIPICMNHLYSAHPESPCNVTAVDKYQTEECEVSTIKLQSNHHVTLFYYSSQDHKEELSDPVVQTALKEMASLKPELKTLWDAMTPYEFAVAMLYRHFYHIKMPFEHRKPHEHTKLKEYVPMNLKHVIFVPGVLMCVTAHLERELVPLPSPDGKLGPYDQYPRSKMANMQLLLNLCKENDGVMLEENHCTHVTLGVTKEYKPVASNNICQGVKSYLEFLTLYKDEKPEDKLWNIVKINQDKTISKMKPSELLEILHIYASKPTQFKHAKRSFVEITPYINDADDEAALEEAAKRATFEIALPPDTKHSEQMIRRYKRTRCCVADGGKWIYIRHLPIDKELNGSYQEETAWFVDAYISKLDRPVTGEMRFF
ncbi:uncharacterized protein BXIN_2513 [Babesia sp. Xinjiang]|uniref:uncharacterized protein n=1 Tax=Babesia sp. Xinjiang TaxID=462227 RepID=UPI000A237323|nr:uncharacterized protein BXIN_2513 [Babesia sp. Xinjiang]ORM41436.1 hypothetical protein BXIN_2513 [Babesia sp. Xinjiang]